MVSCCLATGASAALAVLATRLGFDTDVEAQSLQMSFAELPRLAKTLPVILRAKNGGALILEDARADPMKGSVAIIRDPNDPDDEQVAIEEIRLAEVWEDEVNPAQALAPHGRRAAALWAGLADGAGAAEAQAVRRHRRRRSRMFVTFGRLPSGRPL